MKLRIILEQILREAKEDWLRKQGYLEEIIKFAVAIDPRKYTVWIANQLKAIEDVFPLTAAQERVTKDNFKKIIDWANAENPDLFKYTYRKAFTEAGEWHKQFTAKELQLKSRVSVKDYPDGFAWAKISSAEECEEEGDAMGHCAAGYWGQIARGSANLYSLRDKGNSPHVTIEMDGDNKTVHQIKGKQNDKPDGKYHKYIIDFLATVIKPEKNNMGYQDFDLADVDDVELFKNAYNTVPVLRTSDAAFKGISLKILNPKEAFPNSMGKNLDENGIFVKFFVEDIAHYLVIDVPDFITDGHVETYYDSPSQTEGYDELDEGNKKLLSEYIKYLDLVDDDDYEDDEELISNHDDLEPVRDALEGGMRDGYESGLYDELYKSFLYQVERGVESSSDLVTASYDKGEFTLNITYDDLGNLENDEGSYFPEDGDASSFKDFFSEFIGKINLNFDYIHGYTDYEVFNERFSELLYDQDNDFRKHMKAKKELEDETSIN